MAEKRGPLVRQAFKVELIPDYDQKKAWRSLQADATSVVKAVRRDLENQVSVLGFPIAKNLFLEGTCGHEERGILEDVALAYARDWAYGFFCLTRGRNIRARKPHIPIHIRPEDVAFSVSDEAVRVPYLGTVKHRPNKFIIPGGADSEEKIWLLANTRSMFLREVNCDLCLIVDSSEKGAGQSNFTKSELSRKRRKMPGLLE